MGIATDKNISSAILQFVRSNQFPEIEEVASASVRVGSLPDLTDGLRNARENLEVRYVDSYVWKRSLTSDQG